MRDLCISRYCLDHANLGYISNQLLCTWFNILRQTTGSRQLPYSGLLSSASWLVECAYVGGYVRKKGENLATQDDILQVVDQLKLTTEATKAIEAQISDEVWNRQMQWQVRRDILLEMIGAVSTFHGINVALHSLGRFEREWPQERKDNYLKSHRELEPKWTEALEEISRINLLAMLTCDAQTVKTLGEYESFARGIGVTVYLRSKITVEDIMELRAYNRKIIESVRRELHVPEQSAKPQSTDLRQREAETHLARGNVVRVVQPKIPVRGKSTGHCSRLSRDQLWPAYHNENEATSLASVLTVEQTSSADSLTIMPSGQAVKALCSGMGEARRNDVYIDGRRGENRAAAGESLSIFTRTPKIIYGWSAFLATHKFSARGRTTTTSIGPPTPATEPFLPVISLTVPAINL